jgi:hypothetical protein
MCSEGGKVKPFLALLFALTALIAIVQKPRAITLPHGGPTILQDWLGRVKTTQRVHAAFAQSDKPIVQYDPHEPVSMKSAGITVMDDYVCYRDANQNGEILCSFAGEPFHKVRPIAQGSGQIAGDVHPTSTVVGPTPQPEWVPDPSAGHYDCPDGWTAMRSAEPEKWRAPYNGPIAAPYYLGKPNLDKKGHVLAERPSPPVCVSDAAAKGKP